MGGGFAFTFFPFFHIIKAALAVIRGRNDMEMLLQAILTLLGRVEENQRDRRGRLRDAFWLGVLRGVGSLLGFAVAGTALVYILQYLAERNLPGISDFLARVVTMVQMRLQ